MSNYNDTSKLPVCDKHRREVIDGALRREVIPLTVGMKLEQAVETLRGLLLMAIDEIEGADPLEMTSYQNELIGELKHAIKETEASHAV